MHLTVQLLGIFRVEVNGSSISPSAWRLRTAGLLVKSLALAPDARLHREQLMDQLWPDSDPDTARSNLRYSLHSARRALASTGAAIDDLLIRERDVLLLAYPGCVSTDVAVFEEAITQAWRTDEIGAFRHAVGLYTGDLLPEDRYEDWIEQRRMTLRTSYLAALGRLATLEEVAGDLGAAIATLQSLLALEPLDEAAHTALMRVFASAGNRQRALAQFDRLCTVLMDELETEPDATARELADAIQAGQFPPASPSPAAVSAVQGNLPTPLTALLGRARVLAEVQQFIATHRLVTLTGPGGVGKTRLALEVGRESRAAFPEGVWFAPLASLRDPDLLLPTIIQTLGLRDTGSTSALDQLVSHLCDRRVLLILDNLEQVLDAAPQIAQLLWRCPGLRILTTGRARLRVRGEQVYPVQPLEVPPQSEQIHANLIEYPTVRLFEERAMEVEPSFRLTASAAPLVAELCRRLDGLPLAIELAAARINDVPLLHLTAQLERRLAILTEGPRDLPDRHQTLWNTIAWSYDLLTPIDRRLFRTLAVTAGGWTQAAAEAVADDQPHVVSGLHRLVERNLMFQHEQDDGMLRYGMLETIREFGEEHLERAEDADDVRRRHGLYMLHLVERAEPHLAGTNEEQWRACLRAEHENLRTVLNWSLNHDAGLALQIAGHVWRFWYGEFLKEGRHWLSLALASDVPDAPAARAKALDGAGVLALAHGDIAAGRRYIEAFQEEAGNLRDLVSIARATFCRGILAGHERRLDDARDAFSSALLLYHELGDRRWTTAALNNLGSVAAMTGEVEEAVHYYLQSLEMAREAGDTPSILMALQNLGWQDVIRGRLDEATMRYEECMTIVRTLDDRWRYAGMLIGPAVIALERGDLVEARRVLTESLSIHHELGDEIQVATMIEWLGRVVIAEGDPVRAARWFRVTAAVRDRLGSTFDHFETSVAERYVQMGIAQVGEAAWSEAWSSGTSMTLEDAYQEALVRNP